MDLLILEKALVAVKTLATLTVVINTLLGFALISGTKLQ